jgi:hypothetical protein
MDVLIRICFILDDVDKDAQTVGSTAKERCHRLQFYLQRFLRICGTRKNWFSLVTVQQTFCTGALTYVLFRWMFLTYVCFPRTIAWCLFISENPWHIEAAASEDKMPITNRLSLTFSSTFLHILSVFFCSTRRNFYIYIYVSLNSEFPWSFSCLFAHVLRHKWILLIITEDLKRQVYSCKMYGEHNYYNSGHYPLSFLLFKTPRFGGWILSCSSGRTY